MGEYTGPPPVDPFSASAWNQVATERLDKELREEIAYLRARIVNLEKIAGVYKEAPVPEAGKDKPYKQPGVKW